MFEFVAISLLLAIGFAAIRVFRGPTVFDRVIAANSIGTLTVLLLSLVGYLFGRPEFIDLAITYALLNVIGTVAVLKFFKYGDLSSSEDDVAE